MKVSRAFVAMFAASLLVALAAAPSASAASGDSATATASQKRISTRTLNTRLNSTRRQVATARRTLSRTVRDLGLLTGRVRNAEGGLGTLLGAAPTLISSLTTLGNAVRNDIAPGLTKLADAVQNTIGPGLTNLRDFTFALEYGAFIGRIELPPAAGGTVQTTPALVSADIPDSGNPTFLTPANVPVDLTAVPAAAGNVAIGLRGAIRSNESDGAATGSPAGQMGGLLTITCLTGPCQDGTGAAKDPGELVCTTQTPSSSFPLPNNATTNQRLVNIQEKVALTDTSKPDGSSTDIIGSTCAVKGGAVYGLNANVASADLPTSASPAPKD